MNRQTSQLIKENIDNFLGRGNCKANSAAITASEMPNSGVDADELGLTGKKSSWVKCLFVRKKKTEK